jgi:hypothetical protein
MARDSATLNLAHFSVARDDRPRFQQLPVILRESGVSSIQEHSRFFTSAAAHWITRRSLSSGGHSADPLAGDDNQDQPFCGQLIIICAHRAS